MDIIVRKPLSFITVAVGLFAVNLIGWFANLMQLVTFTSEESIGTVFALKIISLLTIPIGLLLVYNAVIRKE